MTITLPSMACVQYSSTAEMARTRTASAAATAAEPAPAAAPTPAASSCAPQSCDSPRRSPLYRALMGALGSMVDSAPPPTTTPGTTSTSATGATPGGEDPPVDLDEAVMNFASALMQALRGGQRGDDGADVEGHGHRHHHHDHRHAHHDHGRRAWGDPAQRIEQLGMQLGAATPPVGAGSTEPVRPPTTAASPATDQVNASEAASNETGTTPVGDTVLDPVGATDLAPAGSLQTARPDVNLRLPAAAPAASPFSRTQQNLLDSFATLAQALGLPAVESGSSLNAQLSAFLQTLAEKLRGGANDAMATTQPGALLSVTA